jgi:hypothetical protein
MDGNGRKKGQQQEEQWQKGDSVFKCRLSRCVNNGWLDVDTIIC